jgi:Suppressor of fused protein (SUFU)
MTNVPTDVAKYLEDHLGPIQNGREFPLPEREPFSVVQFADRPMRGATTFATLGLSERVLAQPAGGANLRQELLMAAAGNFDKEDMALLLASVVDEVWRSGLSLDRGAVIGPRGPLFSGSPLEALYCAPPAYFPAGLAMCTLPGTPLVIVWLVPVTAREAAFAREGFGPFEALLQVQNPNLLDLARGELVLPARPVKPEGGPH